MLVEDLETLVVDLLKQSKDAVGDSKMKEWMSKHLDDIIVENGRKLHFLLKYNSLSDAEKYLEKEYKKQKVGVAAPASTHRKRMAENECQIPEEKHPQTKKRSQATSKSKKSEDEIELVLDEVIIVTNDRF